MNNYDDLRMKVEELLDSIKDHGIQKLEMLISNGSGIVEDHEKNNCNYATPKDFLVAFAKELEHQYGRLHTTRAANKTIKNYYRLM